MKSHFRDLFKKEEVYSVSVGIWVKVKFLMKSELRAKQQQKSFKAFREIADPRGLTGKFFFLLFRGVRGRGSQDNFLEHGECFCLHQRR